MEEEGITYRYDAEEEQDEYVAHGYAGEQGGVEETEHHTGHAHQYALPASPPHEGEARKACQQGCCGNARAHGRQGYPSLRACPLGAKAFFRVHATDAVEIVVHQVGVRLHEQGKGHAQECRSPFNLSIDAIGGRYGQDDGSGRTGEGLGPGGKPPGTQGVCLYHEGKVTPFFEGIQELYYDFSPNSYKFITFADLKTINEDFSNGRIKTQDKP